MPQGAVTAAWLRVRCQLALQIELVDPWTPFALEWVTVVTWVPPLRYASRRNCWIPNSGVSGSWKGSVADGGPSIVFSSDAVGTLASAAADSSPRRCCRDRSSARSARYCERIRRVLRLSCGCSCVASG
jgi:hypothetical protein